MIKFKKHQNCGIGFDQVVISSVSFISIGN